MAKTIAYSLAHAVKNEVICNISAAPCEVYQGAGGSFTLVYGPKSHCKVVKV